MNGLTAHTTGRPAVIIPCYNAGTRIRTVVEDVSPLANPLVVVDDGSTDGGTDSLSTFGAEVLHFPENRGKGYALLAGLAHVLQDPENHVIVLMDADGQHDPADMEALLSRFHDDEADLVVGQRQFGGARVPWRSRFGNQATITISRLLLGRRLPDTQCGYRVLSRRFAEAVLKKVAPGRYETEMDMLVMAVKEGYRLAYAPIHTVYEPGNQSSHFRKISDSIRIYARLLRAVLRRR